MRVLVFAATVAVLFAVLVSARVHPALQLAAKKDPNGNAVAASSDANGWGAGGSNYGGVKGPVPPTMTLLKWDAENNLAVPMPATFEPLEGTNGVPVIVEVAFANPGPGAMFVAVIAWPADFSGSPSWSEPMRIEVGATRSSPTKLMFLNARVGMVENAQLGAVIGQDPWPLPYQPVPCSFTIRLPSQVTVSLLGWDPNTGQTIPFPSSFGALDLALGVPMRLNLDQRWADPNTILRVGGSLYLVETGQYIGGVSVAGWGLWDQMVGTRLYFQPINGVPIKTFSGMARLHLEVPTWYGNVDNPYTSPVPVVLPQDITIMITQQECNNSIYICFTGTGRCIDNRYCEK